MKRKGYDNTSLLLELLEIVFVPLIPAKLVLELTGELGSWYLKAFLTPALVRATDLWILVRGSLNN
jgi:hypothetical protein